ncbi:MAG: efflux transporter outer membrane subunit [Pseudomonadota bacterium]
MIRVSILTLCALLAGCTVGPDYRPRTAAELGVPEGYSVPAPATRGDLTRWWTKFDDPLLASLVERAAAQNLDVAASIARLRQAREALVQSRSSLLPSINGSAGYNRSENLIGGSSTVTLPDGTITSISRGSGNSFSLGLDAQYQLGLFGEIRRTVEASRAQYQAAGYDQAAVLVATEAEVARNYILVRLAQAQLANARASLRLQDDNLEIAGFRVDAGLVSSLDREQARSQRAQTAASIPSLEASYNQAVSRLGVLTGQAPGALKGELAAVAPIPTGPRTVAAGIPADTLRQRPDVLSAERALAAATAQIGVAKAALYPALAISGSIDTNAASLAGIGDAITGGLFAGLTQAIFNGGRLRSQVRSQQAAADGAFLNYRQTVLTALEEVENAIVALRTAQDRERAFTTALDAADTTALLARLQYRNGLTDFITLNQSESALLQARNGISQARADQATALIQLYNALGGGWDATVIPEAPRSTPDIRQDR